MIVFYRILFPFALLLSLPYYGARMLKRGGYGRDWRHRFGGIPPLPAKKPGVHRLWIQAVSVGEVRALQPVIDALAARDDVEVVLTTTTSTGYALVLEHYRGKCARVGIFPVDWAPFSRRAWNRIQPDLAVLMEGELWPEHLHQARQRGVPVILVNGRLSDRSFRRYEKVAGLARRLFGKLHRVFASSAADAERFARLGVAPDRLETTGNLKFDVTPSPLLDEPARAKLRADLGFPADALVLLGSSTWPGEEAFLLRVQNEARAAGLDVRLLIIPRHAERRREIRRELEKHGVTFIFRSEQAVASGTLDVYVGDTTGELVMLSQAADVGFIGKSLPPNSGGQTPIEAAALGLPIVYGPAMGNFRRVCQSLEAENAAWRAADEREAAGHLLTLLREPETRRSFSTAARQWHARNQGAVQRLLTWLNTRISGK